MRILLSGSTGLVGSALCDFLEKNHHEVTSLIRKPTQKGIYWNPEKGQAHKEDFENFDAIIHLAGKNISNGKWTEKLKREIFQSRCRDTWFLSQLLTRVKNPPKTLIVASAVGFYGSRGDELLTESSHPGKGFLPEVCTEWEKATASIEARGVRVVHTRLGVVLSPQGGALKRLLMPFRLGLGAILGSGNQYLSWIALEDAVRAMEHILECAQIDRAINLVSPSPEKIASFSKKLAQALHRPLFFKIGEKPLRWIMGEMADEMLLASVRAIPKKLNDSGYCFVFPKLEDYFKNIFIQ